MIIYLHKLETYGSSFTLNFISMFTVGNYVTIIYGLFTGTKSIFDRVIETMSFSCPAETSSGSLKVSWIYISVCVYFANSHLASFTSSVDPLSNYMLSRSKFIFCP